MTGLTWPLATAFTPLGNETSLTRNELLLVSVLRSMAMNSGMSAGKQETVISVSTWLTMQFSVLTAGDSSSPL